VDPAVGGLAGAPVGDIGVASWARAVELIDAAGGGGHQTAAGFTANGSPLTTIERLRDALAPLPDVIGAIAVAPTRPAAEVARGTAEVARGTEVAHRA
jgi:hypothetical protein